MLNFIDIFINLKYTINKTLNEFNDLIFKRDRSLDFNSVFLFICKYNSIDSNSYNSTISSLIIDNIIPNISKTAFILKLKLIDYTYFIKLNNIIIDFFYSVISKNENGNQKPRILAIDGSIAYFKKQLYKEFKLSKNKNYTTGNISCLFDVDNNIPINYLLSKSFNERDLLIEQLSYVKTNDIIVADRGYFSNDVINKIIENNSNFIFRITKNKKFISNIKNNESSAIFNYIHNGKIYKFKIYKYSTFDKTTLSTKDITKINKSIHINKIQINKTEKKILHCSLDNQKLLNNKNNINNNEKNVKIKKEKLSTINILIKENIENKRKLLFDLDEIKKENTEYYKKLKKNNSENDSYYILTSCYKMSNDELIKIYLKRWGVETNFRFLKSTFKFNKLNSLNINAIKQNLYSCQFLFIIESLINYITPNELINKENIMINIIKKKDINELIFKNINTKTNDNNANKIAKKNIKSINNNKSLTLNLIGNHLLKNIFITKKKKKEKKEIYKKKCNKKNKLLINIIKSTLGETIIILNEIIKNKIDHDKIKKNNIKNKNSKKRINRRPRGQIWI